MRDREKDIATIPYYVHEGELARMERVNRRLTVLCVTLSAIFPLILILGRAAKK